MRDEQVLALVFELHRPRLLRVAYATLGSLAEAEDCVQEAWLRLRTVARPEQIPNLGAWLTAMVSQLALEALAQEARDPSDRVTLDEPATAAARRRPPCRWRTMRRR